MLRSLVIHNLALIESLSLDFSQGFTSLTGETGAGKSILLDALGLTLGNRADSSLVRHGTTKADISAEFDLSQLPSVQAWLEQFELQDEQASSCLLRRTVTAEGRSKAFINGIPTSANQLKQLAAQLIDIHGQHEHQTLLKPEKQLELLDLYAQHPKLLNETATHYQSWLKLQQELKQLQAEQADRQAKLELLDFQLKEFNKIAPQADEFTQLAERQKVLAHAQDIQQACFSGYESIEGNQGVSSLLHRALQQIESLLEVKPEFSAFSERLNSLLIDTQDLAEELHHAAQAAELDPHKLSETEQRLSELFALGKKYQLSPEDLPQKHQALTQQRARLIDSDATLTHLASALEQAWQTFEHKALQLRVSRQQAAQTLSEEITQSMHSLGMPNGQFNIRLSATEHPTRLGLDKCLLQVTANKGQPLQPLAKVASGGELSRISLAIQVATANMASLPTLIFDEVDVGIGGGIAEIVGQKMQQISQDRQVFSITHLPQVAVHGNQHLHIHKITEQETTCTQVTALQPNERVQEIARMLGGVKLTEHTLKHAQEMLEQAQAPQ